MGTLFQRTPHPVHPQIARIMVKRNRNIQPPSLEEIESAIKCGKINKVEGIDEIPAEGIKSSGRWIIKTIHNLLLYIWNHEEIPQEWSKTLICPIHEKGNKLTGGNCKGFSLLCMSYKIFTKIDWWISRKFSNWTRTIDQLDKNENVLTQQRRSESIIVWKMQLKQMSD